jgi:hypothetical protein
MEVNLVRPLSDDEKRAIDALKAIADTWPKRLMLFFVGGELKVTEAGNPYFGEYATIDIPSDAE